MAILSEKSNLRHLRGRVGNLVFRQYNGKTIVCARAAKSTKTPSSNQTAHRQRFARASAFARAEMQDPAALIHYKALAHQQNLPNAYIAAVRHYLQEEVELLELT